MLPCQLQNNSFFDQLQNTLGLDLRDKRGLKHELAIILLGVTLSLLCKRDGNMSSIHRHMKNHHKKMLKGLHNGTRVIKSCLVVSRSQLPIILGKVSLAVFEGLLFANYGVSLSKEARQWFALDGKELKGSIGTGSKRGEAVVQAVSHQNRIVQSQDYYNGKKESEVVTVRNILKDNNLQCEKISMDALHCKPDTLEPIQQAGGTYLVGLKGNQKELLKNCTDFVSFSKPDFSFKQEEIIKPKHGREEIRSYHIYNIAKENKHKRWDKCQIDTLIEVKRTIVNVKTKVRYEEISHYISNQSTNYIELCYAVRGHWSVEVNNHIRDVTFAEDDLKTKEKKVSRSMAAIRTLACGVLNQFDCTNKTAQIENFADDYRNLIKSLKKINFL